jgi:hypothetical protein
MGTVLWIQRFLSNMNALIRNWNREDGLSRKGNGALRHRDNEIN